MSTARQRRPRTRSEPAASAPVVWFVGQWQWGEFIDLRQVCASLTSASHVEAFATLDETTAAAGRATPPEVLLLAQPRPGCVDQAAVDQLQAAAPLTRIVVVAGSWCEGERRTGRPLAGAVRLYWHEVPTWLRRNLALRNGGRTPEWSRPGDPSEAAVASLDLFPPAEAALAALAVDAIDFATFQTLADALRAIGFNCVWTPRGRGVVAGVRAAIWDGGQLDPSECAALAALRARLDGPAAVPIVALLDYPRAEHIEQARALGAAAVLGKPYSVASMVSELSRLVGPIDRRPGATRVS